MTNRKKLVTEMGRIDRDAFSKADKLRLVVVLDNVRSLHNVGSVFRTGDAFRVERIMLCGITATPPSAEIHKTALGAEDVVEWQYFASTMDAVAALRSEGFKVFAIEQCEGSVALQDFVAEQGTRYAVVLGNEVKGVQQEVVDASDGAIEIPQFGTKHSLNVSVTAGMVIWEFAKKLGLVK
ncbi:MAG: RNA methyltransferase [Bacteroidaceae bacterium]|nr:RNA methyltransferase [Bacteroidaceae bacterium]